MKDTKSKRPRAAAVLVAAGKSTRMAAGLSAGRSPDGTTPPGKEGGESNPAPRKPFLKIQGQTLLEHTARAFASSERVDAVVVVAQPDDFERVRGLLEPFQSQLALVDVVAGGAERTDSVRAGAQALAGTEYEWVAVHDAARSLIRPATIDAALATAVERGAALVAHPARDTIKLSTDGLRAEETLDRSKLWVAQTPQVFQLAQLLELLERAQADGFRPTDDAALYERYVGPIPISAGDPTNWKITTPEDLELADALLRNRS